MLKISLLADTDTFTVMLINGQKINNKEKSSGQHKCLWTKMVDIAISGATPLV